MQSLFFTNTMMLAGMAALGVPILIHLLLKRKKKKAPFSTIRFFLRQDEQSSRRRKLRNWLLLALRLLIVTLLVLAFARPYSRLSQASAAAHKLARIVFVLDNSTSMLASGTEGQRWTLAKARIQKILSGLNEDDRVALVECATHSSAISGFTSPATVAQLLQDLAPSYGTSSLGEGLHEAVRLMAGNGPNAASTIYVVSDLQKAACRTLASCAIPQNTDVKWMSVGDLASPNLAIVRLEAESHDGRRPEAVVASFSDEDAASTSIEIAVDDRRFSSQVLSLKAGTSTNIDLALPALKPGWHELKASLISRDALEADNARYCTFFVPEPAQVLVVEPRSASRVFEQETFFLSSALDPTKDSTNSLPGAFNLIQIPAAELPSKLKNATAGSGWNVVVLPGLKDLDTGIGQALNAFVQDGGGLMLFLGEDVSANRYNSELRDLLPVRVGDSETSPDVGSAWRIALYDTNSSVFAAFRSPNTGDLRIPRFTKRYSLEALEGATRLAFFDDGAPLLIIRFVGRGKVALVNTSADAVWNDWPKHKTFVPFLHGLTKYLAQHPNHNVAQENNTFIAGEDVDLEIGVDARLAQPVLRGPDGKETRLGADDRGRLKDPMLTVPGVYSLRDKTGREIRRLALNVPPQESNLEAFRASDVQQQLVRIQDNPKQTLAAGLLGARDDRRELWTALLLGALILLLVEPFVANRTSI